MKKIWLGMLLPILTMVMVASCENDMIATLYSTKILQDLY